MDSHFSCLYFVVAGSRSTECSRATYFNEQTLQSPTAVEGISAFPLITFKLNLSLCPLHSKILVIEWQEQ